MASLTSSISSAIRRLAFKIFGAPGAFLAQGWILYKSRRFMERIKCLVLLFFLYIIFLNMSSVYYATVNYATYHIKMDALFLFSTCPC